MPEYAGTVTKLHLYWPGRCQNEARNINVFIKLQRNVRTGRDRYKTIARIRGTIEIKQEGYTIAVECQGVRGRLQNCSEIGHDGAKMKHER